MRKIAFFDTKSYDRDSFLKTFGDSEYSIKFIDSRLYEDTAILANDCDAVCAFVNDDLSKGVLDILSSYGIRIVVLRCAGYNNVDLDASYGKIHVLRVPAYSPYAVAEHALALLMALNRKTHKAYNRTRNSNFSIAGLQGFDLYGKSAGIVGTGKIGRIMIDILKGFGMNILAYDYYRDEEYAKTRGISYVDLDFLYKNSDVISLHCPLTKETHHLIDNKAIEMFKDGVFLINTSRGSLIDTESLIYGLKTQKIGAAGLDVYEEESAYFFEDFSETVIQDDVLARLLTFNNVLITSHQAFLTNEALANIASTTLKNLDDFFEGNFLENEICYRCDKKPCKRDLKKNCF
ncbi:MAG: 2-hydroxyacid dehydrogenase [Spirochaetales bacterium]|nr:2-hydroxyacid dehydrogenase [Spirochaetales bacterium]